MCEFCGPARKMMIDEYDSYEAQITPMIPFPAIDLTTGAVAKEADPPYFALFVGVDLDEKEDASFVINFCPMCGEKLKLEMEV